jgi:hypothetical protein
MTLLSLWRAMGAPTGRAAPVRSCRPVRRRILTMRPLLESLEDRTVPSNLFVTKTLDDVTVPGTLRYAVANAQNGDTIILKTNQLNGPIVLTQSVLDLNVDLTIRTSGSGLATIDGNHATEVFRVEPMHTVSLADLLITNGHSFGFGGGILNAGTLTVSSCSLTDNFGFKGGGIANFGTLTVSSCSLFGNTAQINGGGIASFGTLTVSSCTLTDNSSVAAGGIANGLGGTATVSGSTLSGNFATLDGGAILNNGGIYNFLGTLTVSGSALIGNSASDSGGGIYNATGSTLILSDSTLSGNSATNNGGGIDNEATLTVTNSTVSGNHAGLHGGDLYEDQSAGAVFTVTNSTITDIFVA